MASLKAPAVPPSLAAVYAKIIRVPKLTRRVRLVATLQPGVFSDSTPDNRPLLVRRAEAMAEWIQTHRAPGLRPAARHEFILLRRDEILAGAYPPEYWTELVQVQERTQLAVTTNSPAYQQPKPPYYDAARLASDTEHSGISSSYPTPAPYSTGAQPSAGWHGEVSDGYFIDTYAAQLRYDFKLPVPVFKSEALPIWTWREVTLELSASSCGNVVWLNHNASFLLSGAMNPPHGAPTYYSEKFYNTYRKGHGRIIRMDAPVSPWAQTIQISSAQLVSLTKPSWLQDARNGKASYLHVYICAIPPNGYFYSHNDWAHCWLSASVRAYIPRVS